MHKLLIYSRNFKLPEAVAVRASNRNHIVMSGKNVEKWWIFPLGWKNHSRCDFDLIGRCAAHSLIHFLFQVSFDCYVWLEEVLLGWVFLLDEWNCNALMS